MDPETMPSENSLQAEERRLNALYEFKILDTPREEAFDSVAELLSGICQTPIAVINLIGDRRQFFKAEVGLGVRETPLESSFCVKAILEEEFLIVPDATKDARFDCNPLVTGEAGLRFYAGALLKTDEGLPIGTVCVLDTKPRELSLFQENALKVLAKQVMDQLKLRLALRHLHELNETLECKVAARTLELSQYKGIVEATTTPVCAFDSNYRLIAFNRAHNDEFRRVNGFDTKIGDVFPDLFLAEQQPVMRSLMDRALSGEQFTVLESFGRPELGQPVWEISYTPIRDETGVVSGAFHLATDISERLRAENDLRVAQDALRQSQKMEAVGQLTGGLAHDFNNLLTGVMGNLELLLAKISRGRFEDVERLALSAQAAGRRAAALTQRLLAFSRRQTLDPKPTDVNRLIGDLEELINRTIGPAISLEVVGAAGLWTACIDAGQLENSILNLCINARDAMPDGGRLTIETANKWLDERAARERELPPGQYLSVCVSDTGIGMSPETMARAFDPFFTTKPLGEGTGLGLSMIYGFAKQSGGQVRVYSELGKGTTMCMYFPRYIGSAEPEDNQVKVEAVTTGPEKVILVIDDEPTVLFLVEEILNELGHTVLCADDGASGLKILESKKRVDLVITDVGLPHGLNGRQVADAARLLHQDLPILFITGYAENAAVGNGLMEPGMEVLTKPFTMVDLARRVQSMLRVA